MGMLLGAVVAALMTVAMQVPLLHVDAHVTTTPVALSTVPTSTTLQWPSVGSAAVDIPGLGVTQQWNNHVEPIASLTKLMTAYVVLQKLPLTTGETGPCITVNAADVYAYDLMKDSNQSSAAVAAGEQLCEFDLLSGLLVHSASNYAAILADVTWGSQASFIAHMNADAVSLALVGTHYADVSGFNDASVSTAADQARLAALLMASPVVRAIVDQTSVTLPVAGTLNSFTPYVGQDNVIGVKSGRTSAAGGCDVMAMTFVYHGEPEIVYAAILGARGGDLLTPAGNEALALAQSATTSDYALHVPTTTVFGHYGWGATDADLVLSHPLSLSVPVSALRTSVERPRVSVSVNAGSRNVRPGDIVGWARVATAWGSERVALTVSRPVGPLTLWQRLR